MIALDTVEEALSRREVDGTPRPEASVAAVLAPGQRRGAELLLIERAQRKGDPWSGHMAFPGGRREAQDRDSQDTALRETWEEVGLEIPRTWHVGRLLDQHPRLRGGFTVAAHVFALPEQPAPLRISEEVQEAWWVPLIDLVDPLRYRDYPFPGGPQSLYPGIAIGEAERERVVWGMTHRFLRDLFETLGYRVPSGKR